MKWLSFLIFLICFSSCETTSPFCVSMTDSFPINSKEIKIVNDTQVSSDFSISFNPLLLPISIQYSEGNGFTVSHSNDQQIITPLGFVGLHYSLAAAGQKSINGHPIATGDFVVGLVNTETKQKQVFKIAGYSKLRVVTEGKTTINAEAGYVEIDVTKAAIREIKFIDNSKFTIINTTNKLQKFAVGILNSDGHISWGSCEVEPLSYKFSDIANWAKSYNSLLSAQYLVKVLNDDDNNDKSSSTTLKVDFGEVCQILSDNNGVVTIEKKLID